MMPFQTSPSVHILQRTWFFSWHLSTPFHLYTSFRELGSLADTFPNLSICTHPLRKLGSSADTFPNLSICTHPSENLVLQLTPFQTSPNVHFLQRMLPHRNISQLIWTLPPGNFASLLITFPNLSNCALSSKSASALKPLNWELWCCVDTFPDLSFHALVLWLCWYLSKPFHPKGARELSCSTETFPDFFIWTLSSENFAALLIPKTYKWLNRTCFF